MEANPFGPESGVPHARFPLVSRDRLVSAIETGVSHQRLVVISAPAGYGKSTLLDQWSRATRHSVVMVTLGPEVTNIEQVFRKIQIAWSEKSVQNRFDLVMSGMLPETSTMLSAFTDDCNESQSPRVFVLDDYATQRNEEIDSSIDHVLANLSTNVHFVISCRGDPGLSLSKYRVRHELLEIGPDDLRFSRDEIQTYFLGSNDTRLEPNELDTITTHSEGWPAGLRLMSLVLRYTGQQQDFPAESGHNRFVWDYLKEEILNNLSDSERQFVLKCSILDRMNGSLCGAITGYSEIKSQQTLELLERDGIFTRPLDYSRDWYRFHDVFRGFLIQQFARESAADAESIHRSAAHWHLEHDLPNAALRHAIAGNDLETAIAVFDQHAVRMLTGGEMNLFGQWMATVPPEWIERNPRFDIYQTIFLVFVGAGKAAERCLHSIEQRLSGIEGAERASIEAQLNALRCLMACVANDLPAALDFGERALLSLPENDSATRSGTHHGLADILRMHGHWDQARHHYLKIFEYGTDQAFAIRAVHAFGGLADLELLQGHLGAAETYWLKALNAINQPDNFGVLPLPTISWVHIRLSEILYERNHLVQAWAHLRQGLDRVELSGDLRTLLAGYTMAARLKLTEGDLDAAATYLDNARPVAETSDFPDLQPQFERIQVELWFAQNRIEAAKNWIGNKLPGNPPEIVASNEWIALVWSRICIASYDDTSLDEVAGLLQHLVQTCSDRGQKGLCVNALAQLALLHWTLGEHSAALPVLLRCLVLAEDEGYIASIVDLGMPMARLLQLARSRKLKPEYIVKLLQAFEDRGLISLPDRRLPVPLTPREIEIMNGIAAGLTNREIADAMYISAETVKKHTGNIYAKLDARGRLDAVSRCRALGILQ